MEKEEYNDQVEGRNAVLELLESGRDIKKWKREHGTELCELQNRRKN